MARDVVGVPGEQRLELGDRLVVAAERRVGAAQLPARLAVARACRRTPLLQLGDAAVVVAAVPVGDLEVGLRHLHRGIELERAGRTRRSPPRSGPSGSRGRRGCCARRRRTGRCGGRRSAGRRDRAPSSAGRRHRIRAGGWRRRWPAATACRAGAGSGPRSGSAAALDLERGLDAEDEVAVVAEVEIGRGEHRAR